jgi:hypothetical protein
MENVGYLKASWRSLTADKEWWQPVILLALASLIPIIGPIAVVGYILVWAREAAWGLDRPIPRKLGDLGDLLKLGFFATVIIVVWVMILAIISVGLSSLPFIFGVIGSLAGDVLMVGGFMICSIAVLRATIYNSITPGFQLKMAWEMAKHDWKGLARVLCIGLVGSFAVGVLAVLLLLPIFAGLGILFTGFMYGNSTFTVAFVSLGIFAVLWVIVIACLVMFADTLVSIIFYRALGIWMEQFKPGTWGPSQQPLPFMVVAPLATVPLQPQPYSQPQPQPQPEVRPSSYAESDTTSVHQPIPMPPVTDTLRSDDLVSNDKNVVDSSDATMVTSSAEKHLASDSDATDSSASDSSEAKSGDK